MTFLEAAYRILKQVGRPLHYREITERALQENLLDTGGLTPGDTMGSRLYTDTLKPKSLFRRAGKGLFALKESRPEDIAYRINQLNQQIRKKLHRLLREMQPDRFEALIGELLLSLGFDESTVEVTSFSRDGGIDVRGLLHASGVTKINAAVQVKRWKRNVRAPTVRELRGSLKVHEQGIIITTSGFSKSAIEEAEEAGKTRISLVDGEQLINLLVQHSIGVTERQHAVLSLDEEWWEEMAGVDESEGLSPAEPDSLPKPIGARYPLPIRATVHGQTYDAEMLAEDGRIRYAGKEYGSPSEAGKIVSGWKAVNGWVFWEFRDPDSSKWRKIDALRR